MPCHRRRNQGGQGDHTPPPRFQNICSPPPPPQISKPENKQHWLEITFKHVLQFLKFFARGLCIHSYMEIKELIHNPRSPFLFSPPPQVVTNFSHFRLFTTRSTRLLVMCGVLVPSCTRYGVWDASHLKITPTIRCKIPGRLCLSYS